MVWRFIASKQGWRFVSNSIVPVATCLYVLIVAVAVIFEASISAAWETGALATTFLLCGYTYLDILHCGEKRIDEIIDSRVSGWLMLLMIAIFLLLGISTFFAWVSHSWLNSLYDWKYWPAVHAAVIALGAIVAAIWDRTLAKIAVNRAFFDGSDDLIKQRLADYTCPQQYTHELHALTRSEESTAIKEHHRSALDTLMEEKQLAERLLWLADLPAVIAYLAVLLTVLGSCRYTDPKELKMFIGGSVALGLVIVNWVHLTVRFRSVVHG